MRKLLIVCLAVLAVAFAATMSEASMYNVWGDTTGDGFKDTLLGSISGYSGIQSAVDNYNYYSWSAHPVSGPALGDYSVELFMYETAGNPYFNVISGQDNANHDGLQSTKAWFQITGSLGDPVVLHSDDNGELAESTIDNLFLGDWKYINNSDGGILGGILGQGWEIKIQPRTTTMTDKRFYSSDGSSIFLDCSENYYYFITPVSTPIPEPASMMLLGSGLLGLVGLRRKK